MFRTLINRVLDVAKITQIFLTLVDLHHAFTIAGGVVAVLSILQFEQILNAVLAGEMTFWYCAKCKTWYAGFLGKNKSDEAK